MNSVNITRGYITMKADVNNIYFTGIENLETVDKDTMQADFTGIDLEYFVSELDPEQKEYILEAIGISDVVDWVHAYQKEQQEDRDASDIR